MRSIVSAEPGVWRRAEKAKPGKPDWATTATCRAFAIEGQSMPPTMESTAMIRSRALALILVCSLINVATISADDPVAENLAKAVESYTAAVDEARETVLVRYEEEVKSLAKANRLSESLKVREEMRVFRAEGIFSSRATMKDVYTAYATAKYAERETLRKAYAEAIKQYLVIGEVNKADNVRSQAAKLGSSGRLASIAIARRRTHFLQHADYKLWLKAPEDEAMINATFEIVRGLAADDAISIRSVNLPNHFVAHGNLRLYVVKEEDSDEFRRNATFRQHKGLSSARASSFEALNFPGHYIRARGDALHIERNDGSAQFKADATFLLVDPLYKLW